MRDNIDTTRRCLKEKAGVFLEHLSEQLYHIKWVCRMTLHTSSELSNVISAVIKGEGDAGFFALLSGVSSFSDFFCTQNKGGHNLISKTLRDGLDIQSFKSYICVPYYDNKVEG